MPNKKKVQVVESERSPEVYSANEREQMICRKNIQLLGRSEKSSVHRITIDQKILSRRFKQKLYMSKLAHARMTGNRQLEKELRETSKFRFNTNMGDDDDDESLRRIWHRTATGGEQFKAPEAEMNPRAGRAPHRLKSASTSFLDRKSAVSRPTTSVSIFKPKLSARPVTAFDGSTKKVCDPRLAPKSAMAIRSKKSSTSATETTPSPTKRKESVRIFLQSDTESCSESDEEDDDDKKEEAEQEKPAPTPAPVRMPFLYTMHKFIKPKPEESKPAPPVKQPPKPAMVSSSMFGQDRKKPTLLDFHKKRIQSANYEAKVKDFVSTIGPFNAELGHVTDYYTLRLTQNTGETKQNLASYNFLETPLSEYKRNLGNVKVRQLTLKPLNIYDGKEYTSCIDINAF